MIFVKTYALLILSLIFSVVSLSTLNHGYITPNVTGGIALLVYGIAYYTTFLNKNRLPPTAFRSCTIMSVCVFLCAISMFVMGATMPRVPPYSLIAIIFIIVIQTLTIAFYEVNGNIGEHSGSILTDSLINVPGGQFCVNCGAPKSVSNQRFCGSCGIAFGKPVANQPVPVSQVPVGDDNINYSSNLV
eukprot:TRINITY_DN10589_c0_g1_i1.p1 TRINITY_DN10589_c0_g1~~TRINITY_DN10589_c0_g1_i1.p1  ORF type:complete len:188 (-),score=-1.87 TRINITY_DN10589_c0_g1_i1:28-591(-)